VEQKLKNKIILPPPPPPEKLIWGTMEIGTVFFAVVQTIICIE